jgi:hypothetical protein
MKWRTPVCIQPKEWSPGGVYAFFVSSCYAFDGVRAEIAVNLLTWMGAFDAVVMQDVAVSVGKNSGAAKLLKRIKIEIKSESEMDMVMHYIKKVLPSRTKERISKLLLVNDVHREWLSWCAAAITASFNYEQSYFALLWRMCETYRWFTRNREFSAGLRREPPPLDNLVLYAVHNGCLYPKRIDVKSLLEE